MSTDKQSDARRKALRAKAKSGEPVQVSTNDLLWLLDECGRLQQGNDRLRRQNRRLRVKMQRAGVADDEPELVGDGDE